MIKPRFQFGQVVVVEEELVGVVVKVWTASRDYAFNYEVYVKSYNAIKDYPEHEVMQYIHHKELEDWEKEYYWEER